VWVVFDVLLDDFNRARLAEVRFARSALNDVGFVNGRLVVAAVALHVFIVHEERGPGRVENVD